MKPDGIWFHVIVAGCCSSLKETVVSVNTVCNSRSITNSDAY